MSDMPEKWAIEGFLSQLPSRIAERIIADKIAGLAVDVDTQEFIIAGARLYAQLNKEPKDAALVVMRKAIAAYESSLGSTATAHKIIAGSWDKDVLKTIAYIREQGFDIVKVGSAQ